MRIEYSRDSHRQYLILSEGDTPSAGEYPVCMLTENEIPGFLTCRTEEINRSLLFLYDITDLQTLRDFCSTDETGRERLVMLLRTLAEALETLDRFLLPADSLLLSPDLVFLDRDSGAVRLVCYPDRSCSFAVQIQAFSEYLLSVLKNEDRDAVVIGYAFYQKCRDTIITADGLRQLAQKRAGRPLPSAPAEGGLRESGNEDDISWLYEAGGRERRKKEPACRKESTRWLDRLLTRMFPHRKAGRKKRKNARREIRKRKDEPGGSGRRSLPAEGRRTQDPGKEEHTVLLIGGEPDMPDVRAVLMPVRGRGQMPLRLDRDQSILGRNPAAADLVVTSPLVSRVHARLLWQKGQYCIEDISSRNGTWVNGRFLPPGSRQPLKNGDELLLGDQRFRYERSPV